MQIRDRQLHKPAAGGRLRAAAPVALLAPALAMAAPSLPPNQWVEATLLSDGSAVDDAGACGGQPCARAWFPLDYHAGAGRIVLFGGGVGGGCGNGYVNDVWELYYVEAQDAWQWEQRRPVVRGSAWPEGMDNHVMAYDADNERLWILGGTCRGGFGYYDYASNTFTEVGSRGVKDGDEPYERVFDPGFAWGDGELVVFSGQPAWQVDPGGRTTSFDTSQTTPAGWDVVISCGSADDSCAPPVRQQIEEVMVYVPTIDRFVVFGGQAAAGGELDDTWEYDPERNTWTEITGGPHPSARQQHIMVYDSTHDVVIMHGGASNGTKSDTWAYNPRSRTWKELTGADGPPRRLHGGAYDPVNDVVVMWSGADPNVIPSQKLYTLRYAPGDQPRAPADLTAD